MAPSRHSLTPARSTGTKLLRTEGNAQRLSLSPRQGRPSPFCVFELFSVSLWVLIVMTLMVDIREERLISLESLYFMCSENLTDNLWRQAASEGI